MTNERWVAHSEADPTYFSAGGSVPAADPGDWGARRFMVEARAFTYDALQRLPADAAGTSAFLSEGYHTNAFTGRIFGEALELAMAPTPPAALAAAYRAISQRPEVHYAGTLADPGGRRGIALIFEYGGVQNQLLLDPVTGAAFANRGIRMADGGLEFGTVLVTSQWTDSVPQPAPASGQAL